MSLDRADELRALDDLWPEVAREIPAAAARVTEVVERFVADLDGPAREKIVAGLETKFRRGEAEHGRDWLSMDRIDLLLEVFAEVYDLTLYLAMERARFGASES